MHASSVTSSCPSGAVPETPAAPSLGQADAVSVLATAMETAREHAGRDTPLLIVGEHSSGRARVARAVHYLGPRRERPFICLHCAALRSVPLDSMLPGLVQLAAGGTLFLDGIASLPDGGQALVWRQAQRVPAVRWIAGAEPLPVRAGAAASPSTLAPWPATARIDLPARAAAVRV
nr:sigma 54-interacting transcriptional regulator [Variovorax boronicumulans]